MLCHLQDEQQRGHCGTNLPVEDLAQEPVVAESDVGALTPLAWGAKMLIQDYGQKVGHVGRGVDGVDRATSLKRIRAAAEYSLQQQDKCLEAVTKLIERMCAANQREAAAFVENVLYDETEMDCRIQFHEEAGAERQRAHIYVVERRWAFLIRRLHSADYSKQGPWLIVEGQRSPIVVPAEGGTGETVALVVSCEQRLPEGLSKICKNLVRVSEIDEGGSNLRAENIALQQRSCQGQHWMLLHSPCLAHKVHASSVKTWSLSEPTISGMVHTAKVLESSGGMRRLRDKVLQLLKNRFVVVQASPPALSPDAPRFQSFPDAVLLSSSNKYHWASGLGCHGQLLSRRLAAFRDTSLLFRPLVLPGPREKLAKGGGVVQTIVEHSTAQNILS